MAFLLSGVGAFSVGASGRRGKRLAGQVTPMTPGLKLRGEIGRRESLGFWLRLAKTRRVAPAVGDLARAIASGSIAAATWAALGDSTGVHNPAL
jgi:hypothetical protein